MACNHFRVQLHLARKLTGRVTKWLVLLLWILAVAGLGSFAGKLSEVQNNEAASWLPDSAESTRAMEKLASFQDPDAIPTVVVYSGKTFTPTDLAQIAAQKKKLAEIEGVEGEVIGPIPSKDGTVAQTVVTFNLGENGWNEMSAKVDAIHAIADGDGIDVHITGPGGQANDAMEAFAGLESTLLFAALGVVIVILLFVYRSPTLWLLPIVSAIFALMASLGLVYFLAKYAGLTVNGQSQAILSILVIGAGTDYALLLVARYREELRRHEDRHEAMAFALHRATPAIIASGATVALGMLCLIFAEMNSTAGLGPVVAVGIVVTLLVMTTLLPALLVICDRWIFWPMRPSYGSAEPTQSGLWAKVGARIKMRPRAVWVGTSLLLALACLGLLQLNPNGLSTEDTYTKEFESITGQKLLAEHGLVDTTNTVMVVANAEHADEVRSAMAEVDGVADPSKPVLKDGVAMVEAPLEHDVASTQAFDAVLDVRKAVHEVEGADALVGGESAFLLDTKLASERDNRVIIPLILVVVLLVLIALLRSLAAPLILLGTVVLSFGAALGLSALIFRHLFDFPGTEPSFPLFAFVFLVALGIDYNIFLMTRVREETMTRGTRAGALVGLTSTGGVITSAGLVLAATFVVLGSLPMVFLVELGVAVALGVMLDTMIVRSVLVTAINLDLGNKIWWPSKLDRQTPLQPADDWQP